VLVLGGVAVAVAVAAVVLTLRSSDIGVAPAEAACPTTASLAQCARAMAAILWASQSGPTRTGPPRIAVSVFTGFPGRADIYTMNSRGGDFRRLTKGPGDAAFPTWSPDGRRIAFNWTLHWASQGAARGIYVMNADGSGRRLLARAGWGVPTWSPDGSRIAFWRFIPGSHRASPELGIYIVNAAGHIRLVKRNAAFPAWSPDGSKIAYSENNRIYVMNPNGTGQRFLGRGYFPAWSPDGQTIAFLSPKQSGNHTNQVWIMNADGSDERPLHIRSWVDCELQWSPRGRLAVSNPAGLFLVRRQGHVLTKLSGRNICGVAWQPVGAPRN
jgi:Tol biopolymer transport system component